MHSVGMCTPATVSEACELYESLGPTAQTVVREVAKAMSFDRKEYRERVTSGIVMTARDALFASLLEVTVGTQAEFDEWCAEPNRADCEIELTGSENVENVVWHLIPFVGTNGTIIAATFHDKETAAVETLRRQAFGRHYQGMLKETTNTETETETETEANTTPETNE
jgi:hypothetical protein